MRDSRDMARRRKNVQDTHYSSHGSAPYVALKKFHQLSGWSRRLCPIPALHLPDLPSLISLMLDIKVRGGGGERCKAL